MCIVSQSIYFLELKFRKWKWTKNAVVIDDQLSYNTLVIMFWWILKIYDLNQYVKPQLNDYYILEVNWEKHNKTKCDVMVF